MIAVRWVLVAVVALGGCDRSPPPPPSSPPSSPVGPPREPSLTGAEWGERARAFEALCHDARPIVFALAVERLHHEPDDELRTRVRDWVVSRPYAQVAPVVSTLVASEHPEARAWLAAALTGGEVGAVDAASGSEVVVGGHELPARLAALAGLADDSDARVRMQAAAGTAWIVERAIAAHNASKDPDGRLRLQAPHIRSAPLVALQASRDPLVRARVAEITRRCVHGEDDWRVVAAALPFNLPLPAEAQPAKCLRGRYLSREGFPADTEPLSVAGAGARWLVRHQDGDGSWDGARHNPLGTGGLPGFAHEMAYARPALAGLGLLALLQAGAFPESGRIGVAAAHAAEYLLAHQSDDGRVGLFDDETSAIAHAVDPTGMAPPKPLVALFNHAISTWALVELALTTRELAHERAASRALRVLAVERHHRHPWSRWFDPTDDVAYAGYAILALLVERAGGERWSDGALLEEAAQYLRLVSRPDGRVYHESVRPHCFGGYDSAATGLFLRGLLPLDLGEAEPRARALLFDTPPVWNDRYRLPESIAEIGDDPGAIANVHLWHFGALVAARRPEDERARAWQAALTKMLAQHQRTAPWADEGAWDPIDPWGRVGGRVYSTAMSIMARCAPTAYRWE